ncbi:hypothetical protein AVEN_260925-2-1, partial [Araneus ventricosus]
QNTWKSVALNIQRNAGFIYPASSKKIFLKYQRNI